MSTVTLAQFFYLGLSKRWPLDSYVLKDWRVAIKCLLFSESHIAEPKAQFNCYVRDGFPDMWMYAPIQVRSSITGTGFEPQEIKKACQGVGGHLGEGVTATVFVEQVLQGGLNNFAHIKVGMKQNHRCPDFVAVIPLSRLYDFYRIPYEPNDWLDNPLPIPVEAKSAREKLDIKTVLRDVALKQLIYYWWRISYRQYLEQVVGYGVVTLFVYTKRLLCHILVKPKSEQKQRELIAGLKGRDLWQIRANIEAASFIEKVEGCLEGFGGGNND